MSLPIQTMTSGAGIFGFLNLFERAHGPHYYQSSAFFRNMPTTVRVNGFTFHPIHFDYVGLNFAMESGEEVKLTGKVFGQGGASTVFEGKILSGANRGKTVAVKLHDHSLLSLEASNQAARNEIGQLKRAQQNGLGRVEYFGQGEVKGMVATVTNAAPGTTWTGVNPQWINQNTFQEVAQLFDQLEAKGYQPGDFEINIDSKGRVYLVDLEGIDLKSGAATSREAVFARLNWMRSQAGLKAIDPIPAGGAMKAPKTNLFGTSYRGFFTEAGWNGLLGFSGYGLCKLAESLMGRRLSTTETIGFTLAPAAPVVAYSSVVNYLAARSGGSGIMGSVIKTSGTLGRGLAGGVVTGIGASFLLNDLGVEGEAHTVGTIALGAAGTAHPAGIAFFGGYAFGTFLNWSSKKLLGKSLSSYGADGIEAVVDGTSWVYHHVHPTYRAMARKQQAYEAAQERKYQAALIKARHIREEQEKSRASHALVDQLPDLVLQESTAAVLDFMKTRNKEIKQGKGSIDFYMDLVAEAKRLKATGKVGYLDFGEKGEMGYLFKLRTKVYGEQVYLTWLPGREPYLERIAPGTLGTTLF